MHFPRAFVVVVSLLVVGADGEPKSKPDKAGGNQARG
jgi:hypothetical protein